VNNSAWISNITSFAYSLKSGVGTLTILKAPQAPADKNEQMQCSNWRHK